MSFGGSPSRPSFGRKGSSSPQKKVRKKKQDFHRHKVKFVEEGKEIGFEEIKSRVVVSLDRLGHQRFSLEPGGYSFENWMMSFNLLLDDFEAKVTPERLPQEYFERRLKLTEDLMQPVDTSDLDQEIEKLRNEERQVSLRALDAGLRHRTKRDQEVKGNSSTIGSLKKERERYSRELEEKKSLLVEKKKQLKSASLFRKVFSGASSSEISSIQKRIEGLETTLEDLDGKISDLQDWRRGISQNHTQDSVSAGEGERLSMVQSKISELEGQRLVRMQFAEKREEATKLMAEIISGVNLPVEETASENKSG